MDACDSHLACDPDGASSSEREDPMVELVNDPAVVNIGTSFGGIAADCASILRVPEAHTFSRLLSKRTRYLLLPLDSRTYPYSLF